MMETEVDKNNEWKLAVADKDFAVVMTIRLQLFEVEFKPLYPVGSCCIILAYSQEDAEMIARRTIMHTSEMTVKPLENQHKPGVVIYLDGNY